MRTTNFLLALILTAAFASSLFSVPAQDAKPYPRISEEAFKARLAFFDYDKAIPLEGRVVRQWDEENSVRQKIVKRPRAVVPSRNRISRSVWSAWRLLPLFGPPGPHDSASKLVALHTLRECRQALADSHATKSSQPASATHFPKLGSSSLMISCRVS